MLLFMRDSLSELQFIRLDLKHFLIIIDTIIIIYDYGNYNH